MKKKLSKTRHFQENTLEAMGCGCGCSMDCNECSGGGSFYVEENQNKQVIYSAQVNVPAIYITR